MNILFLCVGNSARSQIAEGLAKHMFGKGHNIQSAGSKPSGLVHQGAIDVMQEAGIDLSNHSSKSIEDLDNEYIDNLDYVITLCAEEICPILSVKTRSLHWMQEDPVKEAYNKIESRLAFEKTRDDIFSLLKKFMIDNL
jgi:arsenate reductase